MEQVCEAVSSVAEGEGVGAGAGRGQEVAERRARTAAQLCSALAAARSAHCARLAHALFELQLHEPVGAMGWAALTRPAMTQCGVCVSGWRRAAGGAARVAGGAGRAASRRRRPPARKPRAAAAPPPGAAVRRLAILQNTYEIIFLPCAPVNRSHRDRMAYIFLQTRIFGYRKHR